VPGINLALSLPATSDLLTLPAIVLVGLAVGVIPAIGAYRLSLGDGLSVRV